MPITNATWLSKQSYMPSILNFATLKVPHDQQRNTPGSDKEKYLW
jgi:hypothetical protein